MSDRNLFPWVLASVASLTALVSLAMLWQGQPVPGTEAREDDGRFRQEIARLRGEVVSLTSESEALRAELDRLRGRLQARETMENQLSAAGENDLTDAEKRERLAAALGRLPDLVPRMRQGDPQSFQEMRDVFMALARAPMDDPELFYEAFRASDDPMMRTILLPHLVARDRAGSAEFLKDELAKTRDPELRSAMLERLRFGTSIEGDPEAQSLYLAALESEPSPRARAAAVEALSSVPSPEIQDALLQAARSDADPGTREAAIRRLAENPATRSRVVDLLAEEPNERLRTVGECTAKLADLEPSP